MARREVPAEMLCPISCDIMNDPVTCMDGQTYERVCIEQWFAKGKRTSPVTNEVLSSLTLVPNIALRALITRFLDECRGTGRF